MNTIDKLIQAVSDRMPKTNREMLVEFPRREMRKALDFVDTCCKVAQNINPGAVEYTGHEVLKPEDVVRFLIYQGRPKDRIPTVFSELKLVRFNFVHNSHEGRRHKEAYQFLPYMHEDYLVIRGRKLAVHKGISARVFTRDTETETSSKKKDKTKTLIDVLLVNPNRVKIQCKRHIVVTPRSAINGDLYSPVFIITAKAHDKSSTSRKKVESTLVLYLLAKYGLPALMERFDIPQDVLSFTEHVPHQDSEYDYFEARDMETALGPMFYMKVRRADYAERTIVQKVVCETLYLLANFGFQNMDEVFDPGGTIWKTMLGRITSNADNDFKAFEEAKKHLMSADFFLDPLSQRRYKTFGVDVKDFYELVAYIFEHIDDIIVNTVPQDLYNRKIDITDTLFISAYAEMIFGNFYYGRQQSQLKDTVVNRILNFNPFAIEVAHSRKPKGEPRDSDVTIYNPTLYGSDWLSAVGVHKVRRGGSALQRFHSSMAYVESLTALSGSDSGRTGYINPFVEIDPDTGAIIRAPWAQDADALLRILPKV